MPCTLSPREQLAKTIRELEIEDLMESELDSDREEDILSYNPLNTNSINNHSSINRQPIYYSITLSQLVFLPVIIYNQLVRPTDRSSTRMFLSNLTSLTLTLNSTSNFHHQQLYLRQPEDGTDDDFINDEELNPDPIDPEYILGSPTSEMVRYSHPQLFITNEPES
ncbi:hypothetical protein PPACK8108_LOCUS10119 [Phakopsora pachyrhizi]|uniref:Uncharacterized protein n=1 Tax=Phakopsora pachyrhizi TaxID=170000 RepID=A0AAV0AZN5_PHAPC|nr:hypothetical protein PPACK8108_LOCUS10119 [Phakopsora pachyrhizi]